MFSNRLIHSGVVRQRLRIALQAQRIQPPRIKSPDRKARQADPDEGRRIQHRPLEFDRVRLDLVDPSRFQRRAHILYRGPQIKFLQRECNHHPVGKDQRQRAAHRLQRPPQQQAPLAARHVLHHQQSQPAHRKSKGQHQSQQPGSQHMVHIEAASIRKAQAHGNHREDQPDNQRAPLPAVHKGRRAQLGGQCLRACWRRASRVPFRLRPLVPSP